MSDSTPPTLVEKEKVFFVNKTNEEINSVPQEQCQSLIFQKQAALGLVPSYLITK